MGLDVMCGFLRFIFGVNYFKFFFDVNGTRCFSFFLRSMEQDVFLCTSDHEDTKNQILIYQCDRRLQECILPFNQIKNHTQFNLHYDLIDCGSKFNV